MKLKFKKMREDAIIPKRMTAHSAGCDLTACLESAVTIGAGETAIPQRRFPPSKAGPAAAEQQ